MSKRAFVSKIPACPYCGLLVEHDQPARRVICPQCFRIFAVPRSTDWTVLIVPILALQFFSLHVL
jgi:DNA-directed RNA polymerase subunit RPC12/RpoP